MKKTVALIAGGYTFGKTHGAADAGKYGLGGRTRRRGPRTARSRLEEQLRERQRRPRHHQRPRGDLDDDAHDVENDFFSHRFGYEWELTKSPAGANQWKPKNGAGEGTVPNAHDASKKIAPSMLTTDLALRVDPAYEKISRRFHQKPAGVRGRVRQGNGSS